MTTSRTTSVRRVEFSVDWPPGHVAAYLLDGPEPVLVDAGMAGGGDSLDAALSDAGRALADVEHLVVTHPHIDHIGATPRIVDVADPTVYAPAGVRERFGRDSEALADRVRANARAAGITVDSLDAAVEMAVDSLERNRSLLPRAAVDRWIEPGETVSVGDFDLEAVHAPGHQADHLCYLTDVDEETALLSGDMAIEPFRAVALHDGLDDGYREAVGAFFDAIDRLAALDVERVFPGHGPVHAEFDEVLERDRRSLRRRLDAVLDLLGDGYTTVPGVAAALSGDRDVRYMIPEAMSVVAHLVETGRARTTEEDGVTYYEPS